MKQKYIKPTTAIVKLRLNKFICLSKVEGVFADKEGIVLSRRNRYWDDEEDDFDF